jgi:hypothetical protein
MQRFGVEVDMVAIRNVSSDIMRDQTLHVRKKTNGSRMYLLLTELKNKFTDFTLASFRLCK